MQQKKCFNILSLKIINIYYKFHRINQINTVEHKVFNEVDKGKFLYKLKFLLLKENFIYYITKNKFIF
jgi:hypothetical protein